MLQRLTLLGLACALIVAPGCKPAPTPATTPTTTTATPAAPAKPAAPPANPDDAAAVAELEKAKVILTKNAAGNVERADCKEAALTDSQLPLFKGLPSLTNLSLENSEVTNEGLGTLAEIAPQLKALSLRKCTAVTDAGLAQLKKLANLENLALLYSRITDAGMPYVVDLKGLRALDLRGCTQITDAGLADVGKCTSLIDLKLRNFELTNKGVERLANLNLRYLEIEDANAVDGKGMAHLAKMTDLVKLDMMRTHIDDKGLEALTGMKKLKDLRLRGTSIDGSGLKHALGSKDSLTYLDLSETTCGTEAVTTLVQFANLETLELWATRIEEGDVKRICTLKRLKNLTLNQCRGIEAKELAQLAALQDLEELNLQETNLDDEALTALQNCKKLKTLDISNTSVKDATIDSFKAALPECRVTY